MKTLFFSLLLLMVVTASSQNLVLFKDEVTGKYGFKDLAGKVMVKPVYDTASAFSEGITRVGKKVTYDSYGYGLVNKAGKEFIPLVHDYIGELKDDISIYQLKGKLGYMDKTGKKLTPPKYTNAWVFKGGIAAVSVYDKVKVEDKWGFIDKTGKEIIPLKYNRVCGYSDGIAVVERGEKKYFTINKTAKETPLNYEKIGFPGYDRLMVQQGGKYGYINLKGEVVIPLKYDNASDFSNWQNVGYLSTVRVGKKSGVIDTSGREVVPPVYDWMMLFREGFAPVKMDGPKKIAADAQWGYIDSTGKLVIPMKYNAARYFSEGLAAVSIPRGNRYFNFGFIDVTGKLVIPFDYESAEEFKEGLAAVSKNDKYGFINREGKLVIDYKYDFVIRNFDGGRAKVRLNGREITINKKGEEQ
jgi:WG containing repeat